MENSKSKYPLMARLVDIRQDDSIKGKGIQCFRCGARYMVMVGPHIIVGNNVEGVIGMLCGPCSKEHIRDYMPDEAVQYGLIKPEEVEERNYRVNKLKSEFVPLSREERDKRREKNREKGNLCIVCESEPKEGYEGKYAKDMCQVCYESFCQSYIEGNCESVDHFLQLKAKERKEEILASMDYQKYSGESEKFAWGVMATMRMGQMTTISFPESILQLRYNPYVEQNQAKWFEKDTVRLRGFDDEEMLQFLCELYEKKEFIEIKSSKEFLFLDESDILNKRDKE